MLLKAVFTLRTTSDDSVTRDDVVPDIVRCRPATYMQIICKYPNNMATDVADVVVFLALSLYVFSSTDTESVFFSRAVLTFRNPSSLVNIHLYISKLHMRKLPCGCRTTSYDIVQCRTMACAVWTPLNSDDCTQKTLSSFTWGMKLSAFCTLEYYVWNIVDVQFSKLWQRRKISVY